MSSPTTNVALGKKIGESGVFIRLYSANRFAPQYIRQELKANKIDTRTAYELATAPNKYKKTPH